MTETTQIEAGRELDALVAVEVMGWTKLGEWLWRNSDERDFSDPPRYSTTGDGMLAVLERMRELGWYGRTGFLPDGCAEFQHATGHVVGGIADTLPHAVCLAALEAVRA